MQTLRTWTMCSTISSLISLAVSLFGKGCGLRAELPFAIIHGWAMISGILSRSAGSEINKPHSRLLHSGWYTYTAADNVMWLYSNIPGEREDGIGFILFSSILACRAVILNGSTVYGKQPVNIAYMFTPLQLCTPVEHRPYI